MPADSTLAAINTKVRRITRSPSIQQLSDADLNQYINTFVLYGIPTTLRLFNLRRDFTFYTSPYIDTYSTDTTDINSPLYDFKNKYMNVVEPVYIAGYPAFYSQSRQQFYGIYPIVNNISSIGITGDGITTTFSGTVNNSNAPLPPNPGNFLTPVLANNVTFSSIDSANGALVMRDVPTTGFNGTIGTLLVPDNPNANPDPNNFIDYVTGQFTVTFPSPPAAGATINSETVPYVPALPQSICYFNDSFILRPVPDQSYPVNMEVYVLPTQLLNSGDQPELKQWWQYIAYGAAKLIFEDRMDYDSVNMIMPSFKEQESFVLRTTIVQLTRQRVSTIYTESTGLGSGNSGWSWGGTGNF
jgi:hypothetical protein